MADIDDFDLDLHGYQYLWTCALCLKPAKSGILLEFQCLEFNNYVFFDLDDTPWIKCCLCTHKFHLSCASTLTPAEINALGPHKCCQ